VKKLSLSIDALRVESFQTAGRQRARGTVRGNEYSYENDCSWTGCVVTDAAGGCTVYWCGPEQSENTCLNTCGDGDNCTQGYTNWDGCTNNYKLCG
jgi:hypothetical protein